MVEDMKCYLKIYVPQECGDCDGYREEYCEKRYNFELDLIEKRLVGLERSIKEEGLNT